MTRSTALLGTTKSTAPGETTISDGGPDADDLHGGPGDEVTSLGRQAPRTRSAGAKDVRPAPRCKGRDLPALVRVILPRVTVVRVPSQRSVIRHSAPLALAVAAKPIVRTAPEASTVNVASTCADSWRHAADRLPFAKARSKVRRLALRWRTRNTPPWTRARAGPVAVTATRPARVSISVPTGT